ncbi:hypothetical protein AGMMS49983_07580 [Clostridia bacterium]|nr:hypothetical protein AGMMS49983_07580 [Clostridia bacterium]
MNYDKKTIRSMVILGVLIAAALVFLFWKAPDFRAKTEQISAENVRLERDIAEIRAVEDDPEKLGEDIAELQTKIESYTDGRSVTAANMREHLSGLCEEAGVEASGIQLSAPRELLAAGIYAPALMICEATIVLYGEEGAGYALLQTIESSPEGDYEIVSFSYQKDSGTDQDNVGNWTIVAAVSYYPETPDA